MSLINDMLRDLDARRKQEHQGKTFAELPISVKARVSPSFRWWLLAVGLLLVGAIGWLGVRPFLPSMQNLPKNTVILEENQQAHAVVHQAPKPEPAPQHPSIEPAAKIPESVMPKNSAAITEPVNSKPANKLLGLVVNESVENARLSLNFTDLPEYRLEQEDRGHAQSKLVLSFNDIQVGDNFVIPELTGGMLKRISLRPQQKRLQLLVDLRADLTVESYELKKNDHLGYSLQIVVKHDPQIITANHDEPQVPKEMPAEHEELSESKPVDQIVEASSESKQIADTSHLNKSKNRLNPDKQAYLTGLEQMRKGSFAAAEDSFSSALKINPTFIDARLQLIATLQQQNKQVKAQEQMREGVTQSPENLQLRKVYARFLMSDQHNFEAIKVLQAQPFPKVAQDLEYYALLAALLQETRQFSAAAQAYASLLQLRPETALWWFGLGVSMDQVGDFDQARIAYRRALALPGLSADVQKYVQNRLQVL